jgi:hypothetical protein
MSFDYRAYLKNNPLLKEEDLPKNKWVNLSKQDLEKYKDDIFGLIDIAYSYIGGHSNYKSPNDVVGSEGGSDYEVINLDNDPDIDAVNVSKSKTSTGVKFVASGHDGSSEAKRTIIKHKIDKLKTPGFYIEVSGKIKDILINAGVPVVTDEKTIKKALDGKEITMNDDGTYNRKIAGVEHTKTLLGKPLI